MKYEIVYDFPNDMIFEKEGPFISLYQPTHKYSKGNKQDVTLFKNLVRDVEASLKQKYSKKDISSIMKMFQQIEEDKNIWDYTLGGLAVLANLNKCIIYRLDEAVENLVIVADSLHIKPLVKIFQSVEKYQLLGLSETEFKLYEGNKHSIKEIKIKEGVPKTLVEVLGNQHTEPFLNHSKYSGTGGVATFHGSGSEKDEAKKDEEKFFRYVDKYVLENHSKISKLPLVLFSLKEHHNVFMKITNNPYLMKEGIKGSYNAFNLEDLNNKVWELIEPIYSEKNKSLTEKYNNAKANDLGSDDLEKVALAAMENRVETIIIEAEKIIPGKVDSKTGTVKFGDIEDAGTDDILDDLAEFVMKKKGKVVVLPKEKMPTGTGVAAIYRY